MISYILVFSKLLSSKHEMIENSKKHSHIFFSKLSSLNQETIVKTPERGVVISFESLCPAS